MKIKNEIEGQKEHNVPMVDLTEIYLQLQSEYKTVFIYQIEGYIFIYRPLGRGEFKRLIQDETFNDMQKEEIICQACTLWPEDFDFEDCEAGVPTSLSKIIIKNSYLDGIESRKLILSAMRQEMFDLDNQITCIINEAFPQFDIEEIEQWDIAKTSKYLSRAEWKLMNLRGMEMHFDPIDGAQEQQQGQQPIKQVHTEELDDSPLRHGKVETIQERQERLNKKGGQKTKMTPQELLELQAKYPEMQWGSNSLDEINIESFKDSVDVSSPALRPGW